MKLEKILEKIDEIKVGFDTECRSECDLYDWSCGACVGECDEYIKERAKEIIRKHMNDGWIPVEKFGLPHSNEHDFRFWVTIQYINGFRHTIKAKWDCFDKCFMHQNGKKILQDVIAYKYYSAPEPYRPEMSER